MRSIIYMYKKKLKYSGEIKGRNSQRVKIYIYIFIYHEDFLLFESMLGEN